MRRKSSNKAYSSLYSRRFSLEGWGLYHKVTLAAVVAFFFSLFIRVIITFTGGGMTQTAEFTIDRSASAIWPYIYQNELRTKWEAHVIDLARLSGEPEKAGSTRFLFWRNERGKRWQAVETTLEAVPERTFRTYRQSDIDEVWMTVTLDPISECQTRVHLKQHNYPLAFGKRYWMFFLEQGALQARMDNSETALKRWTDTLPACN